LSLLDNKGGNISNEKLAFSGPPRFGKNWEKKLPYFREETLGNSLDMTLWEPTPKIWDLRQIRIFSIPARQDPCLLRLSEKSQSIKIFSRQLKHSTKFLFQPKVYFIQANSSIKPIPNAQQEKNPKKTFISKIHKTFFKQTKKVKEKQNLFKSTHTTNFIIFSSH